MEVDIVDRIAILQYKQSESIGDNVDVHQVYGLSRSFRRDFNSEALNRGVNDNKIDRNNKLRKDERTGVRLAKLKM